MTLLRFDKVATSRTVTTWTTATANGLTVSIKRTCRRAGRVFYAWRIVDACGDTVDGGSGHDWTMCRRAARLAVERYTMHEAVNGTHPTPLPARGA